MAGAAAEDGAARPAARRRHLGLRPVPWRHLRYPAPWRRGSDRRLRMVQEPGVQPHQDAARADGNAGSETAEGDAKLWWTADSHAAPLAHGELSPGTAARGDVERNLRLDDRPRTASGTDRQGYSWRARQRRHDLHD